MCLSTVWTAERQPVCKNVASVTQKDGQLDLMENEIIIKKATA